MKPNIMPRPISVNAVGKPIMITITMSASMVKPSAASLTFGSPGPDALVRGLVDFVGAFDRALARFLVHERAAGELLLDHVDLLDVLQAIGPLPGPQAHDAADDLGQSLDQHQNTGDRDDGLEWINGRPFCRHVRMFVDAPRDGRVIDPRVYQGDNSGEKEQNVQN